MKTKKCPFKINSTQTVTAYDSNNLNVVSINKNANIDELVYTSQEFATCDKHDCMAYQKYNNNQYFCALMVK